MPLRTYREGSGRLLYIVFRVGQEPGGRRVMICPQVVGGVAGFVKAFAAHVGLDHRPDDKQMLLCDRDGSRVPGASQERGRVGRYGLSHVRW